MALSTSSAGLDLAICNLTHVDDFGDLGTTYDHANDVDSSTSKKTMRKPLFDPQKRRFNSLYSKNVTCSWVGIFSLFK